jgi:hypothetical protein
MTYTCATLEVSQAAYDEIAAKLREAGYDHAFTEDGMVDMTHIGLVREPEVITDRAEIERVFAADADAEEALRR